MEEKAKKEILVVGDLVTPTGFSRVLHSLIKHWKDDYNITGLGVNYRGDPHSLGIPVYPANVTGYADIYGLNRLIDMMSQKNFDIIFFLNDAWVIGTYLNAIKENFKDRKIPNIVTYFPVDARDHNPLWYRDFDIVNRAFTYTNFGKEVVKKAVPNMEIGIIPHGIDKEIFYKKYNSRVEPRLKLFGNALDKLGNPEDLFIVLNANRNQPRKKLDITMKGFAEFAKGKPQSVKLYMHCGIVDSHIDVGALSERYHIDNRLIITSLKKGVQAVSDEKLNDIYNACDVGVNTSMGEGWGLTNIEHAITGAPQVVGDHSACKEIFEDCGLLTKTIADITFDKSMTTGNLLSPESLAENLEVLYANKRVYDNLAKNSVKKFSDDMYDWKTIANTWKEVFEELG